MDSLETWIYGLGHITSNKLSNISSYLIVLLCCVQDFNASKWKKWKCKWKKILPMKLSKIKHFNFHTNKIISVELLFFCTALIFFIYSSIRKVTKTKPIHPFSNTSPVRGHGRGAGVYFSMCKGKLNFRVEWTATMFEMRQFYGSLKLIAPRVEKSCVWAAHTTIQYIEILTLTGNFTFFVSLHLCFL